ncbi:MAG: hypothetical protein CUR34_14535 [Sediminibacterium sp.]|nr:MAG: hypothetical protein CUR34_14535 [Sediminibacterium sp.] [Sediminibacterium sp. FEMGT703S]
MNSIIKSNLLSENSFVFLNEKLEKEKHSSLSNYYTVKFFNFEAQTYFFLSFYELYDKKEINSIHFSLEKINYYGKGYNVLRIDDFCTINNLENKWERVNNFQGITFEEKLNNLITDFEHFVRSTDLIHVFRGEVWYDQYWINPRD